LLPAGQALPGACPVSPPTTDLAFDMNHSPEVPRLPRLPFIVIDVLCLATAAYVALTAPSPLAGGSLIAVVILVALGAIALAVPFIADYGQKTDAALADRQRQIAALAQSTAASAEQISIAAASLHDIGENVARSARAIEGLPQKLHEKIAEFNTRLSEASAADTEELEQELQTLRSAESDRLVNAIDQLAATARELSRVETQIQAHATRAADAIASLPKLAEQTAARSTDTLTHSLTSARKEIESPFVQQRTALSATAFEAALSRATANLASTCNTLLNEITARLDSLKRGIEEKNARSTDEKERSPVVAPLPPSTLPTASGLKESSTAAPTTSDKVHVRAPLSIQTAEESYPQVVRGSDQDEDDVEEDEYDESAMTNPLAASAPTPASNPFPASAAPKRETSVPALFDDQLEDEDSDSALTEDGSTRLLVTAYIGIGNKLFVRGNGAGLSWDKGVPLQFVSIGKWRWETDEAHLPIAVRLYKNDQVECTSVGMITLEPGRQREIVATF